MFNASCKLLDLYQPVSLSLHDRGHQPPIPAHGSLHLEGAEDEEWVVPEVVMHGDQPRGGQGVVHALRRLRDDVVNGHGGGVLPPKHNIS